MSDRYVFCVPSMPGYGILDTHTKEERIDSLKRLNEQHEEIVELKQRTGQSNSARRRRRLWKNRLHACYFCEVDLTFEEATIDHLTPQSKGGKHDDMNMVLACRSCNESKGRLTEEEFREKLNE